MIDRDEVFWRSVCEHPDVEPWVSLGIKTDWLAPLLGAAHVQPFRSEHGGYFLVKMDPLGRLWDLHAAFTPEGWGAEASSTLKATLRDLGGWDLITSTEVGGNWRSRPPRSFGFRPSAPAHGGYRTWILTRAAWEASPAYRRMEKRCLQQ